MVFQGVKFAVIGMGKSGISAVRLLGHLGAEVLAVNNGNIEQWSDSVESFSSLTLMEQGQLDCESALLQMNFIVLSPGISRDIEILRAAKQKGVVVISEIELAYMALSDRLSKIISITGTNGKTTTVTLIDLLARAAGKSVFLGGNIGTPFADYAYEVLSNKRKECDLIILELSSFQLESMQTFKSDAAAILNITPSHGERYEEVRDYALAKLHIVDRMNLNEDIFVGDLSGYEKDLPAGIKVSKLETPKALKEIHSELEGRFHLIGSHNLSNLNFATKLLASVSIDWTKGVEGLEGFSGVKYRLQKRAARKELLVFNDAKSTNWEATFTALNACQFSYPKSDVELILGGQLRGHGDELGDKLHSLKNVVTKLYLFGESGRLLMNEISDRFPCEYFETLDLVVERMSKDTSERIILLSPAFPSFDQYENYIQRGESFDLLVNEYLG
ncbi:UDP-N-acetylmuramoylalanine--D-glutamate ligase [Halobacteriovorax marinus]|uniref:UDP-N-acetylmuramoylalanine--D-glutamate ligase n=1 Tax=Halobacteriovorax marinus TaxID=97084 RepID=A0A1Y5FCR7_9BACT|nr:UDP-N-acetylmuramoylalanine--D-glutamate ligase [Halobacteriovorax marinus]